MDLSLKIEEINADALTTDYFRKNYLFRSKPLIIKNHVSLFPAGKKWNFEYFKKVIGDYQVGVFDNRIKTNTAYVNPDLYIPFSRYLDIIRTDEETPYRIFLFNMFKDFPELRKDFPTPVIMQGILGKIGFAFFGGKNTTVRFHYDIDASNVLMTQVIGRKRVILVSPEYNYLIYKVPFSSFSLIDPVKPDYRKFPALEYVKGYDFILQPGDALFMPSRYWHFNTYLEGGMAVSYRSMANKVSDLYNGLMNTTIRLAVDKTMSRYFPQRWPAIKKEMALEAAEIEMSQPKYYQQETKIRKLKTTIEFENL